MSPRLREIDGPVIVIGDLHGQVKQLDLLLGKLQDRMSYYKDCWLVFIGDIVDRGDDPKKAVDYILQLIHSRGKTSAVMGNHELVLLSALGLLGKRMQCVWSERYIREYSSDKTFESYGVPTGDLLALKNTMPEEHKKLLMNLPWGIKSDKYLIVHAGLMPELPCNKQLKAIAKRNMGDNYAPWLHEQRLVWVDPPPGCPYTVISGHVKVDEVKITERRILVDTTGGLGGKLSAVQLPDKKVYTS